MSTMPPVLISKAVVFCRRIVLDSYSGDYIICAPINEVTSFAFPMQADLAIFARWTSVQGSYVIDIRLQDLEENIVWSERQPVPLECSNPLMTAHLILQPLRVYFPRPGRFEFVFLANGIEVARESFWAFLPATAP